MNIGLILIREICLCWIYVDYTTSPALYHVMGVRTVDYESSFLCIPI